MPDWKVVHAGEARAVEESAEGVSGLQTTPLMGPEGPAVHLEVAMCRLRPGGAVATHIHPFEESFYVLEGNGVVTVAEGAHAVRTGSFGYAPVGTVHGWSNQSDEPLVWIRTRSPQSRPLGDANGTYPVDDTFERPVRPFEGPDPSRRFVGWFDDSMMPAPGPIQMRGFRRLAATNVAVWMLVDEVVGAVHHTLFTVRFDPSDAPMTLGGQHFHPFEETYYITEGRAVAHLEDESIEVGPGDLVFAGINALHGFSNPGNRPVRWIEMQAPNPPPSHAFFFPGDWQRISSDRKTDSAAKTSLE